MFSGFIQAFREISGPAVEDGKVIESPETRGTEKPVMFDEDGELTEEGFVSIGQSSFIYSTQKYDQQGSVPPNFPALYPPLSSAQPAASSRTTNAHLFSPPPSGHPQPYHQPQSNHHYHGQQLDVTSDLPFILHPTLRKQVNYQDSKRLYSFPRQKKQDLTPFSYDFDFERRVLQDIQQQFGNRRQQQEQRWD